MFYSKIITDDLEHGDGSRVTVVLSNKKYHNEYNSAVSNEIITKMRARYCDGLTVAGVGAFDIENQTEVLNLLKLSSRTFPQKDIWCFTEQQYENLIDIRKSDIGSKNYEIISLVDVLVDCAYDKRMVNGEWLYQQSENRRILTRQTMMAILEKRALYKEQIISSFPISRAVSEVLKLICLPTCSNGYRYIYSILLFALDGIDKTSMQYLYDLVAKKFNTNRASVERCIRSSITASWKRSTAMERNLIFDHYLSNSVSPPSNKEFIFAIAEHVRSVRSTVR